MGSAPRSAGSCRAGSRRVARHVRYKRFTPNASSSTLVTPSTATTIAVTGTQVTPASSNNVYGRMVSRTKATRARASGRWRLVHCM